MSSDDFDDGLAHFMPPRKEPKSVSFLPATLTIVAAILALCAGMVYAILVGSWQWGVASIIVFGSLIMVGATLQAHRNRKAE